MQESTGLSDAFWQCTVCGGIDLAPANHFLQLPVVKTDEETEIRD